MSQMAVAYLQGEWLRNHNIPALYGIDTRMLTKHIRTAGAVLGSVNFGDQKTAFEDPNLQNLVAQVSTKEVRVYGKGNSPKIIAFDCGMKMNIIRYFVKLKCELMVVPFDYDLQSSKYAYNGIFISNGPGDPTMAAPTIRSIRWAIRQQVCAPSAFAPPALLSLFLRLLTEARAYFWHLPRESNSSVGSRCKDVQDEVWQPRYEPAVHRHAHGPLLHHAPKPRLRCGRVLAAARLETALHQRE